MPPPGAPSATASAHRNDSMRQTSGSAVPGFRDVMDQAYRTGVAHQMGIGTSKLERLVKAFLLTRRTDQEFEGWLTEYADPTGETAVWNVFKERGW